MKEIRIKNVTMQDFKGQIHRSVEFPTAGSYVVSGANGSICLLNAYLVQSEILYLFDDIQSFDFWHRNVISFSERSEYP